MSVIQYHCVMTEERSSELPTATVLQPPSQHHLPETERAGLERGLASLTAAAKLKDMREVDTPFKKADVLTLQLKEASQHFAVPFRTQQSFVFTLLTPRAAALHLERNCVDLLQVHL